MGAEPLGKDCRSCVVVPPKLPRSRWRIKKAPYSSWFRQNHGIELFGKD
jgi:hypothetical protein